MGKMQIAIAALIAISTNSALASQPILPNEIQTSKIFILVCYMTDRNKKTSTEKNFEIDENNGTINGEKGFFGSQEIIFSNQRDVYSAKFTTVINRYTGNITVSSPQLPATLSGQCVKAEKRIF